MNSSEQIRDIKPLVEIPDSSFYIYYSLVALALLVVLIALFFITKKLLGMRKKNMRKIYLQQIKSIDWKDPKASAYEATRLARALSVDDATREIFSQLEPMLAKYKYKKEVGEPDKQTLDTFNLFVQVADE